MTLKNTRTGVQIYATKLPDRKKPCLVVDTTDGCTRLQKEHCIIKYASFNNVFAAEQFMQILAEFVDAVDVENEVERDV